MKIEPTFKIQRLKSLKLSKIKNDNSQKLIFKTVKWVRKSANGKGNLRLLYNIIKLNYIKSFLFKMV